MNLETVSIVVYFNGSNDNCLRCIQSIKKQTIQEIEIIIVGEQHPDFSPSDVFNYTFIRINNTSRTEYSIYDEILGNVQGNYVFLLNSNYFLFPECIESLIATSENTSSLFVLGYYLVKMKTVLVKIPDLNDIVENSNFPLFLVKSSFETSIISSVNQKSFTVISKPLVCCEDQITGPKMRIWGDMYYFVRKTLFTLINFRTILNNSHKMRELKDRFKGKRCFIIGNGPSLKVADLNRLCGEYTFATNSITKLYPHTLWRPTFFVISDPNAMRDFKNQPSSEAEYSFFKIDYKKNLNKNESNPILYRSKSAFFDGYPPNFSEDPSKFVYSSATVLLNCLQFAYYFGFNEIYLLGVDHNYPIQKTKDGIQIKQVPGHFYSEQFKNGEEWYFSRRDVIEDSFVFSKKIAETRGIKIFNATRGGELELFERVDFDSLFE